MLAFQKLVVDKRNYMMSSLRPPQETKLRGWKRFFAHALPRLRELAESCRRG